MFCHNTLSYSRNYKKTPVRTVRTLFRAYVWAYLHSYESCSNLCTYVFAEVLCALRFFCSATLSLHKISLTLSPLPHTRSLTCPVLSCCSFPDILYNPSPSSPSYPSFSFLASSFISLLTSFFLFLLLFLFFFCVFTHDQ